MKALKEKLPAFLQKPNVLHLLAAVLSVACFLVALTLPLVTLDRMPYDGSYESEGISVSAIEIIVLMPFEPQLSYMFAFNGVKGIEGNNGFHDALTQMALYEMHKPDYHPEYNNGMVGNRSQYYWTKGVAFWLTGFVGIIMAIVTVCQLFGAVLRILRRKEAKRMGMAYLGTASIAAMSLLFLVMRFILPVYEIVSLSFWGVLISVLMAAFLFLLEKMSYDFQRELTPSSSPEEISSSEETPSP